MESRSIQLADHGIETPLFPALPSMPKNADPETWPFVYDREAYAQDRVAQDLSVVSDRGGVSSHLRMRQVSMLNAEGGPS